MHFEIAIEKIEEGMIAQKYGAKRVELSSALELGGLTPSLGFVRQCIEKLNAEIHVLIRPRPGNFIYTPDEFNIMIKDIASFAKAGVRGIVTGALNEYKQVDVENVKPLFDQAKSLGLETTFHRSFDVVADMKTALEQLIELGVDRILTSGHESNVDSGMKNIRQIVDWSSKRIQIMAGGGVTVQNVKTLFEAGVDAVHFTIRKQLSSDPLFKMGTETGIDEEKIKGIYSLINANKALS